MNPAERLTSSAAVLGKAPPDLLPPERVAARRVGVAVLLVIVGLAITTATLQAFSQPFWNDELFTVFLAQLPDRETLWRALNDGGDALPPPFYDVTRLALFVVSNAHVGYRLPAIIGLALTIIATYGIVARRTDPLSALVAAAFLLVTPVAAYAYEARPYGVLLACVSVAVVGWQRAGDRWWGSFVLAVSLAAALSVHYYAVFVWPAFTAAELTWWYWYKRFRPSVWIALVAGALPLLAYRTHLLASRENFGGYLWSPPELTQLLSSPNWLFSVDHIGLAIAAIVTAGLIYCIGSVSFPGRRDWFRARSSAAVSLPAEIIGDGVLALGLLAIPAVAITVTAIFNGDMTWRYTMPAIIGGCIGVGLLMSISPAAIRWCALVVMLSIYGVQLATLADDAVAGTLTQRRTETFRLLETMVRRHAAPGVPVVVSDAHLFLTFSYYAVEDIRTQLVALTDTKAAVEYVGTDVVDFNLTVLARYAPLRVVDYAGFARTNRSFLLLSNGTRWDWWPTRLARDGHYLILVAEEHGVRVYRVTLRGF